jgi:Na+-transporting methylmalonyl-CoA/oxaloacetate decarboxylase beta subunit
MLDTLIQYAADSGFGQLQWGNLVMIGIGLLFIWLAIKKGFEPLLLVPIGFGILIGNIPYDSAKLSLSGLRRPGFAGRHRLLPGGCGSNRDSRTR